MISINRAARQAVLVGGSIAALLVGTLRIAHAQPITLPANAHIHINETVRVADSTPVVTGGFTIPLPSALNDSYSTTQGTTLTVSATNGVLSNDTDPPGFPPLSAALVATTTHGSLSLSPDGSFSYKPGAAFTGTDSFTYQAHSTITIALLGIQVDLSSNIATVTIAVVPTIPPGGDGGPGGPPSTGATPELDSLLLFGTGLSGLGSFALMRLRSARRKRTE